MNNYNKENATASVLLAVLLATGAQAPQAAELTGALNAGVGTSDNLLRTPDNQLDTTIAFVGAEFGYVETGSRLTANIVVNADYLTYDESSIDNELIGGASAFVDYFFVEEVFWLNAQYNFGQQVFDPLTPIRPDNREDVSFVTAGPGLSLPFGDHNSLDIEANYSTVRYELRANDNDRINLELGLSRDVGEGKTISLIGSEEQVRFSDEVINPDFNRQEAFIRWSSVSVRNVIDIDVGYSELELEDLSRQSSGSVFRFDWTRIVSPSTTLTFGAGSRFSDQGDIFRFAQNTSFDIRETEDVIGTATPFRNNFFNATYLLERERTTITVAARWSQEDYEEENTFDRDVGRLNASVSRQLSRKITGELSLIYSQRSFDTLNRDDDDMLWELSFGYQFNPALSAALSYQRLDRNSTLAIDEFGENRIFLTFSYVPRWSR